MTMKTIRGQLISSAAALALTACGGAGGGAGGGGPSSISSTPVTPPAVQPPAQPTPPSLPAGAIGLTGGPFATFSAYSDAGSPVMGADQVQISYSAEGNVYTIAAPGLRQGRLVGTTVSGGSWQEGSTVWLKISSTTSFVTDGDSTIRQPQGGVGLDWPNPPYGNSDLTYTSFGTWSGADGITGNFVYGLPTAAGNVPVTGSATYSGQIRGATSEASDGPLFGSISFQFGFADGTLSGAMAPAVAPVWDPVSLGSYTFRDTVYSSGSTAFSGAFSVPGSNAPSSFTGRFNGPGAIELMGNWMAPYLSPTKNIWGTMIGVFTGKKTP